MVKQLIGLTGLASSGKDTTGDYIVSNYKDWEKWSFASLLKDITAILFDMDRKMLAGETPEDRALREQPNEYWSSVLGYPFTPRMALQKLGTDVLRNHFYDGIWVDALRLKLIKTDKNIIITDCRFPNEIDMIKSLGGEIWRVERDLPEWFRKVESFQVNGTDNLMYPLPYYIPEMNKNIHESEWKWIGYDNPKHILQVNGDFDYLYGQIKEIMK